MAIVVGQEAPAFKLFNDEKKPVSLEDLRGKKVLLLFFPLAFSSVCTAELCSIRDNIARYNEVDATVIGVSVDSVYVLKKFREDQQLNFMLISDFNKSLSRAFDVIYETFGYEMQGVSKRAAFVIDKEGIIRYSEECKTPAELPDFEKIRDVLSGLE
ncbi:MAG: redoxin domain-containing protein [Bacteroidota bacterium]|nr:redoxin domain-containing protein [Ferruginibacter sp.]